MGQNKDRLSRSRLIAFSSLELPMVAFLTPLVVYIPPFYAGEMGLGLATVGLIFGLTKIWDVVTDPIAGYITDRYGPTEGRRRFWLLLSLPFMLMGVYQIFLPPDTVGWLHFAGWMVILYIGWTLLTISHISWGVELSDDYHERARIAAFRQAVALVGSLIIVFIPVLSDQLGNGTEVSRIAYVGIFILVTLPLLMSVVVFATPAKPAQANVKEHHWKDVFTVFRKNRSLRALLAGNMGLLLGSAATASTLLFYLGAVLRLDTWTSFAVVPSLFAGLLFLPGLKALTHKFGKYQMFRWALLYQMVTQPLILLIPPENLLVTITAFLVMGAASGATVFLPQAMIADLKDVKTDTVVARTGIYVALLQSTSKISAAVAVALMFLVLPLTGFDPSPDVINDESSLNGLRLMIVLLPIACYAFGLFGLRNYEIDDAARGVVAADAAR